MSDLGVFLRNLEQTYHRTEYLPSDPLQFVHEYSDPWDQEAVALLASVLAYGNVTQICRSVAEALRRMALLAQSPAEFVRSLKLQAFRSKAEAAFEGYVHRFNRGEDLVVLLGLLSRSWREHGSLGAHFLNFSDPNAADISGGLNQLVRTWRQWVRQAPFRVSDSSSFHFLLTAPQDGSVCKRWCMFLRWMGRKDALDPGLWAEAGGLARENSRSSALAATISRGHHLRPEQLILPLDTHTGRISRYLGLTNRKTLHWAAALEITERLRQVDARDPVRFDFALARLGILDLCQKRYQAEICRNCMLKPVCRFARGKENAA